MSPKSIGARRRQSGARRKRACSSAFLVSTSCFIGVSTSSHCCSSQPNRRMTMSRPLQDHDGDQAEAADGPAYVLIEKIGDEYSVVRSRASRRHFVSWYDAAARLVRRASLKTAKPS